MEDGDDHVNQLPFSRTSKRGNPYLRLFGDFKLECPRGETISLNLRKAEALLAYLALNPHQRVSRDRLAALLWSNSNQARARQSLRQVICALNKIFAEHGLSLLRLEKQLISLPEGAFAVDAVEFDRLIADGSINALASAGEIYSDELLSGLSVDAPEFEDWLNVMRGQYRDKALRLLTELLEGYERAGNLDLAIETAKKALSIDHYREDMHRRLMQVYAAKGLRSSALNQYRSCQRILSEELGVAPEEDTVQLYRSILEHETQEAAEAPKKPLAQADLYARTESDARMLGVSDGISVGRTTQLEHLRSLLDELPSTGSRVAVVEGEAGAGKSHMLHQFLLTASRAGALVSVSRGYKTGKDHRLGLWIEAVDHLLANTATSAASARLRAIHERMIETDVAAEEQPSALVSHSVGRLFGEAIRELAASRMVVFVCDDLHWADDDSLRMLFQLTRYLGAAPVLILAAVPSEAAARPVLLTDVLEDLERDGRLVTVHLDPLSREESIELAWQLQRAMNIKRDSRTRLDRVWLLSEGNPRVIREAVLAASEPHGGISDGAASVPQILVDEVELVQGRLSPTAREMLSFAAVIGRRVDFPVLVLAMGMDDAHAAAAVEELVNAGILETSRRDIVFRRWRMALATQATLLAKRREMIHASVARAIGEIHAGVLEPHYRRLAHHYSQSGNMERALDSELNAARVAMNQGDLSVSRRSFRSALETSRRLKAGERVIDGTIEAHLGLACLAEVHGNLTRAGRCLDAAEVLVARHGGSRQRAVMHLARARLAYRSGDTERSYSSARRALCEAAGDASLNLWSPAENLIARLHLIGGNTGRAIECLDRRRLRSLDLGLRRDAADAAAVLGLLHAMRGNVEEAQERCAEAVELAESIAEKGGMVTALQAQGLVHVWRGNWSAAGACLEGALGIAQMHGDVLRIYTLTGLGGYNEHCAGRTREAITRLERAVAMAVQLDTRTFLPLFKAWLAEACVGERATEEALRLSREVEQLSSECNHAWARSTAKRALARALSEPDRGEFAVAERAIRAAVSDQISLGLSFEAARSLLVQAMVLRARGEAQRSSEIFERAGGIFRQIGFASENGGAIAMTEAP